MSSPAAGTAAAAGITKGALAVLSVAAVLGAGGLLGEKIHPVMDDAPTGMTRTQQNRLEQAASSSLFGQFRSSMADFLYLKVDKYLHKGVDLRGTTAQEQQSRSADQVSSKDKAVKHRGDETTVVPSQAHDWRGVFGDVEREVKPYQDMKNHGHEAPRQALPLYRLMTWSNPHFVPAYVEGAYVIASDARKQNEAMTFLSEGERNNPQSIEIKSAIGEFLTTRTHQYNKALPSLEAALQLGMSRDFTTLNADEKEAYQSAFRWMVLNRREAGDLATARRAATVGLRVFPDDVVCRNFLKVQTPH